MVLMVETEQAIEKLFSSHGVYLGNVFLVQGTHVLELAEKFTNSGFTILGLDTFKQVETGFLPLLDKIADFTMGSYQITDTSSIKSLESTKKFLFAFENFEGYYFSLTVDSVKLPISGGIS